MTPNPVWPGEFVSLGETEVFVRTSSATVDAAADGTNAEPVLCVHGFGGSSTNWTDLMHLLSRPDPATGTPAFTCADTALEARDRRSPAVAKCFIVSFLYK